MSNDFSVSRSATVDDAADPLRRWTIGAAIVIGVAWLGVLAVFIDLWRVTARFPQAPFAATARLYGQPMTLTVGAAATLDELKGEMSREAYAPASVTPGDDRGAGGTSMQRGTWRQDGDSIVVQQRGFLTASGAAGNQRLSIQVRDGRIARLLADGRPVAAAMLEPVTLASFYGSDAVERRPVRAAELPREAVRAVLAAEDDRFFSHSGVSLRGIARAMWVNLHSHDFHQGGSTITQQLVKNLYCSHERTLLRKSKEALLAMMIERRYDKPRILDAYLNSIFWGRRGEVNLAGIGAAARAYFGKDADALTLDEDAELAAMIRAPRAYAPVEHGKALRERRNWVLQRMADLGWVSRERVQRAQAEPLHGVPAPAEATAGAPYLTQIAEQEARERFGIHDLAAGGYQLFATLDLRQQRAAEAAVDDGLAAVEAAPKHGRRGRPLEAALISLDPRSGAILAYVGGRDYHKSQFDRVSQTHRQLGSAFKPVVYAAAFEALPASPATLVDDSPVVVRYGNTMWSPQNYDRRFRGWVTARTAMEQSINVPAVRMAAATGLGRIASLAHAMGFAGEPQCVPALALGAVEVSPREVANVYATLATLGWRPASHALLAVRDRAGEAVPGGELPEPTRVLTPQTAYMVTSMLQGALDHGTGSGARRHGVRGALAGKTGTTSDRRDNWFAGYSPDRVTVVWVGYDDDGETDQSGASAAVPLWSRFTAAVAPPGGYTDFVKPAGMVDVAIDPASGLLAGPGCPGQVHEILPQEQAPIDHCRAHGGFGGGAQDASYADGGGAGGGGGYGNGAAPEVGPSELQTAALYAVLTRRGAWQPQAAPARVTIVPASSAFAGEPTPLPAPAAFQSNAPAGGGPAVGVNGGGGGAATTAPGVTVIVPSAARRDAAAPGGAGTASGLGGSAGAGGSVGTGGAAGAGGSAVAGGQSGPSAAGEAGAQGGLAESGVAAVPPPPRH